MRRGASTQVKVRPKLPLSSSISFSSASKHRMLRFARSMKLSLLAQVASDSLISVLFFWRMSLTSLSCCLISAFSLTVVQDALNIELSSPGLQCWNNRCLIVIHYGAGHTAPHHNVLQSGTCRSNTEAQVAESSMLEHPVR